MAPHHPTDSIIPLPPLLTCSSCSRASSISREPQPRQPLSEGSSLVLTTQLSLPAQCRKRGETRGFASSQPRQPLSEGSSLV